MEVPPGFCLGQMPPHPPLLKYMKGAWIDLHEDEYVTGVDVVIDDHHQHNR